MLVNGQLPVNGQIPVGRSQRPEETDHLAVHTNAGGFYYMMTRKEMSNSSDTAHDVLA